MNSDQKTNQTPTNGIPVPYSSMVLPAKQNPIFALVSCFGGKITIQKISREHAELAEKMRTQAIAYVCNEVGKNNYIDTLNSEYKSKKIEECPAGYVLRYVKPDHVNYGKQIDLYYNTINKGWVFQQTTAEKLGYWAVIDVEQVDQVILNNLRSPREACFEEIKRTVARKGKKMK